MLGFSIIVVFPGIIGSIYQFVLALSNRCSLCWRHNVFVLSRHRCWVVATYIFGSCTLCSIFGDWLFSIDMVIIIMFSKASVNARIT